jgi:hypothetical protein
MGFGFGGVTVFDSLLRFAGVIKGVIIIQHFGQVCRRCSISWMIRFVVSCGPDAAGRSRPPSVNGGGGS